MKLMPLLITKHFEENECELLCTEYENQTKNLDYICKCKTKAKITFKMFLKGQCAIKKRKETNKIIYGNEVSMNSKKIKDIWVEKNKNKTNEEKEFMQNKIKKTNLKKYGVNLYSRI